MSVQMEHDDEVRLVRWPVETAALARYREQGVPRLLIVEGAAEPPITSDVREDWVRPPVSRADLLSRIAAVRARSVVDGSPQMDPGGLLRYGARSVMVSPIGTRLLTLLAHDFDNVVPRAELQRCLPNSCGQRNALDLQIMRLRRRIEPLALTIRTVWGRGYLLAAQRAAPPRSTPSPPQLDAAANAVDTALDSAPTPAG